MQSEILDTKYKNSIGAYHQKLIVVHLSIPGHKK